MSSVLWQMAPSSSFSVPAGTRPGWASPKEEVSAATVAASDLLLQDDTKLCWLSSTAAHLQRPRQPFACRGSLASKLCTTDMRLSRWLSSRGPHSTAYIKSAVACSSAERGVAPYAVPFTIVRVHQAEVQGFCCRLRSSYDYPTGMLTPKWLSSLSLTSGSCISRRISSSTAPLRK